MSGLIQEFAASPLFQTIYQLAILLKGEMNRPTAVGLRNNLFLGADLLIAPKLVPAVYNPARPATLG